MNAEFQLQHMTRAHKVLQDLRATQEVITVLETERAHAVSLRLIGYNPGGTRVEISTDKPGPGFLNSREALRLLRNALVDEFKRRETEYRLQLIEMGFDPQEEPNGQIIFAL